MLNDDDDDDDDDDGGWLQSAAVHTLQTKIAMCDTHYTTDDWERAVLLDIWHVNGAFVASLLG